ncbi:helix-turn-helix domain-containing protein [Kordia sp.]|uniref:helix-turn-helix domain-containing protein n=1 Tax=Kordia sp. TaxID=1965332 RepID=UPI003B5C1409
MIFNPFNIFIISASIHGLIFGLIVLFSKKLHLKSYKYLAYFILLVSVNNIYFWFLDTEITTYLGWEYFWLFPVQWDLLMCPMFFYFISNYLGKEVEKKYYMFPFYISLPFCFFFLFQHIFWNDFIPITRNMVVNFYVALSYVSVIFTGFIIYKGYSLIVKYQREIVDINSPKIEVRWLKRLLLILVFIFLIWAFITVASVFVSRNEHVERVATYILWTAMSFLIYWMGYLGIYHLGIFNKKQHFKPKTNSNHTKFNHQRPMVSIHRFNTIDTTIKTEKLYINPLISLSTAATHFGLSEGYISQLINKHTNTNFSTYINNLRIAEAKRILIDPNYKDYTIVSIALEAGFNSKSVFYNAFKKNTGVSPSAYRKNYIQ